MRSTQYVPKCKRPDCESWARWRVINKAGVTKGEMCGKHLVGLMNELPDPVLIVGKLDAQV
jgi:hypothetical protein